MFKFSKILTLLHDIPGLNDIPGVDAPAMQTGETAGKVLTAANQFSQLAEVLREELNRFFGHGEAA